MSGPDPTILVERCSAFEPTKVAVLITDEHLQLVAEGPVAWFHYTELPVAIKGGPHIKKAITTLEAFLVVRVERFDALDRYIYIYIFICLEYM